MSANLIKRLREWGCGNSLGDLAADRIEELERQLAEQTRDARDAARYRWLRKQEDDAEVFCVYGKNGPWGECGHSDITEELLDSTIDAAMSADKEGK
jgi:hypothetical protein